MKLKPLFKPGTGGVIPNLVVGFLLREDLSPEHKRIVKKLQDELGGEVPSPEREVENKALVLMEAARLKVGKETA